MRFFWASMGEVIFTGWPFRLMVPPLILPSPNSARAS